MGQVIWPDYGREFMKHPCFAEWEVEEKVYAPVNYHGADSRGVRSCPKRTKAYCAYWKNYSLIVQWTPGNMQTQMVRFHLMHEVEATRYKRTILKATMEYDQSDMLAAIITSFMAQHNAKAAA